MKTVKQSQKNLESGYYILEKRTKI